MDVLFTKVIKIKKFAIDTLLLPMVFHIAILSIAPLKTYNVFNRFFFSGRGSSPESHMLLDTCLKSGIVLPPFFILHDIFEEHRLDGL